MKPAQIDFRKAPGLPRLGWLLLALGATGCALALWTQFRWSTQSAQLSHERLAAQALQRARELPSAPVPLTAAQRRGLQVADSMRRPWLPALRAIEAATSAPIYLLSLSIDPTTGTMKIEGEAPTFDHAMAYVQTLDEGRVLRPASLTSHETVVDPVTGRSYVRFTAITRWSLG